MFSEVRRVVREACFLRDFHARAQDQIARVLRQGSPRTRMLAAIREGAEAPPTLAESPARRWIRRPRPGPGRRRLPSASYVCHVLLIREQAMGRLLDDLEGMRRGERAVARRTTLRRMIRHTRRQLRRLESAWRVVAAREEADLVLRSLRLHAERLAGFSRRLRRLAPPSPLSLTSALGRMLRAVRQWLMHPLLDLHVP